MLYTAFSELKPGLFVIHSVQTVNPADQMQGLGIVRGGERACWKKKKLLLRMFSVFAKTIFLITRKTATERGFVHTPRHSLTFSFHMPDTI